ncbi:ABC transporter substrate-binding protein [Shouchella clausii]|uniref:ABC transporter substrate-binding protein n=1 Tax=Shouchella clausii TaxID=79880 RepID=UPI002704E8FA|nr:ABC transporter substrate-binding protein [Shouchella clausii]MDO7266469.1 ABC transporter substrate-binding protein [Shouchella clausii]MDO7286616.1 ABC transporter substrate-binding protein [Shouchella clausii]
MRDWKKALIRLEKTTTSTVSLVHSMAYADTYMLCFVQSGSLAVQVNDTKASLSPYHFYLLKPGDAYHFPGEGAEIALFRFRMYEPRENGELLQATNWHFPRRKGCANEKTADLAAALLRKNKYAFFWNQVQFPDLLYRCLEEGSNISMSGIELAKQYIEENPHARISLKTLAGLSGLHPSYLSEKFAQQTGKSVSQYAAEVKLTEAKRLIQTTTLPLKDIAHRIGYDDEFYFSRKFKKEVGLSPSQYREKKMRKLAAYDLDSLGDLLALRQIPFAAPMHPKWTKHYYELYQHEVPVHLSAYRANHDWQANMERLIDWKPDVLFAKRKLHEEERNAFTVSIPTFIDLSNAGSWKDQFILVAEALHEQNEAQRFLSHYEETAVACKQSIEKENTASPVILRIAGEGIYLYTNPGISSLFHDVGFEGWQQSAAPLSLLELKELAPRWLWVLCLHDNQTKAFYEHVRQSEEWNGLPAVRTGQVKHLPSDLWFEYSAFAQWRKLLFLRAQLQSM